MTEPIFVSSLTLKEIERNFQSADFFTAVMEGLEEVLTFKEESNPPKPLCIKDHGRIIDVAEVRNSLRMT